MSKTKKKMYFYLAKTNAQISLKRKICPGLQYIIQGTKGIAHI